MTQGRLTESATKVLAALGETPLRVKEAAIAAGISEKTARCALRSLVRAKLITERRMPGRGGPKGYALLPSATIAQAITQPQRAGFA